MKRIYKVLILRIGVPLLIVCIMAILMRIYPDFWSAILIWALLSQVVSQVIMAIFVPF
jgi:hypothetical protein